MEMNKCLFTYAYIINGFTDEKAVKWFDEKKNDFKEKNPEYKNYKILKTLLPFQNGELAPAKYFYSLFTIKELKLINTKKFKPKIFLVIDEDLGGQCIKLGECEIIKLVYIEVKKETDDTK